VRQQHGPQPGPQRADCRPHTSHTFPARAAGPCSRHSAAMQYAYMSAWRLRGGAGDLLGAVAGHAPGSTSRYARQDMRGRSRPAEMCDERQPNSRRRHGRDLGVQGADVGGRLPPWSSSPSRTRPRRTRRGRPAGGCGRRPGGSSGGGSPPQTRSRKNGTDWKR
jgi:hypothetical protein